MNCNATNNRQSTKNDDGRATFPLGRLFSTPGVLELLGASEMQKMIRRHESGDWGDCDDEDWQSNENALQCGARIFSVYHAATGEKVWVITEADRASTTVLLPSEY